MVVFAAGNDARGDDALGPLLLARIEGLAMATVRCVFDFQLQVEHALDLDGADMALFVDAHVAQAAPARLSRLRPAARPAACSHALAPDEVLAVYARVCGAAPPPAFLLSLSGVAFELGAGLSAEARESLEAGWQIARALLARPAVAHWQACTT